MLATFAVEVGAAWQVNKRISTSCRFPSHPNSQIRNFAIRFWGKSFSFRLPRYPFKVIFSVTFSQSVFDSLFFWPAGVYWKLISKIFATVLAIAAARHTPILFIPSPETKWTNSPVWFLSAHAYPSPSPPVLWLFAWLHLQTVGQQGN